MNVTLIGMGSGQPENLTLQGLAALRQADLILGARRLLAVLPAGCTENRAAAYRPDEVAELLQASGAENAVLVYSGDTGFYSGASSMMEKLEALGVRARVLPGLSSIQLLAAALGRFILIQVSIPAVVWSTTGPPSSRRFWNASVHLPRSCVSPIRSPSASAPKSAANSRHSAAVPVRCSATV